MIERGREDRENIKVDLQEAYQIVDHEASNLDFEKVVK